MPVTDADAERPSLSGPKPGGTHYTQNRLFLCLCLFISSLLPGCSCSSPDSEAAPPIESKLVGTWSEKDGSTFTLFSDGTFSGNGKTGSWGIFTPTEIRISCDWRFADGYLVLKISKASYASDELVGIVIEEKILSIDDDFFFTTDKDGEPQKYERVH